jgi:TolA-binding protein
MAASKAQVSGAQVSGAQVSAQVLERGKAQEAQQLLDELVKGYPHTTAATKAAELLNQKLQTKPWRLPG